MHKLMDMAKYDDDDNEDCEEDGNILSGSCCLLSQSVESKIRFRCMVLNISKD